jgi:hypothetical protein
MADERRAPAEVINQILQHIPKEKCKLREVLKSLASLYQPPEAYQFMWLQLTLTLELSLNWPPKEDWEKKVYTTITKKELPPEIDKD